MAYQSLYRKHRPQNFAGVVGQAHVTTALRNAVRDGRVGHAYLFSGPRGTGKTTTARILAKALNCLNLGADGEPCGVCENCVAIAEGRFLDLFELDAASNNSVDNIRDLTDSVHLGLGATSKRKVYLVDEVHMLSAAASNALLKTLGEPPEHVVFVLATTNPEKVLPTIRSRTQHLEFTLFSTDELETLLADVLGQEGIDADPEALAVIARAAAGSARDALSLLDQALAHGTDRLDAGAVADLFGGTPFDLRAAVLDAVAGEDPAGVLVAVGALLDAGHEPRRIAEDVLRSVRDAFLLNASGGRAGSARAVQARGRSGRRRNHAPPASRSARCASAGPSPRRRPTQSPRQSPRLPTRCLPTRCRPSRKRRPRRRRRRRRQQRRRRRRRPSTSTTSSWRGRRCCPSCRWRRAARCRRRSRCRSTATS